MSTERPKRVRIKKKYDISEGMPWGEERLVRKVLFLSLREFKDTQRALQRPHTHAPSSCIRSTVPPKTRPPPAPRSPRPGAASQPPQRKKKQPVSQTKKSVKAAPGRTLRSHKAQDPPKRTRSSSTTTPPSTRAGPVRTALATRRPPPSARAAPVRTPRRPRHAVTTTRAGLDHARAEAAAKSAVSRSGPKSHSVKIRASADNTNKPAGGTVVKCERSSWKLRLNTNCGQPLAGAVQEDRRPKVQAQRKFAQSPPNSPRLPVCTRITMVTSLTRRRPKTEDFLSFLCLRGSAAIPRTMTFLSNGRGKDGVCASDGPKDRVQGGAPRAMSNGPCAHVYGTRQQRAQRTDWTDGGQWPLKDSVLSPCARPTSLFEPEERSLTRHIFQVRSNRVVQTRPHRCSDCLNTALVHLHRAPNRSPALPHKPPDPNALPLRTADRSTALPRRLPQRAIALKQRPAQRSVALLHKKPQRPAALPHRTPQRSMALPHKAPERTSAKKTPQRSAALLHRATGRSATQRTVKTPRALPQRAPPRSKERSTASAHRTGERSTASAHRTGERSTASSHRTGERSTASSHKTGERSTASSHRTGVKSTAKPGRTAVRSTTSSHRTAVKSAASSHRTPVRSAATSHRTAERSKALSQRAPQKSRDLHQKASQRSTAPAHRKAERSAGSAHRSAEVSLGNPGEQRFSRRKRGLPPDSSSSGLKPSRSLH